jgi:uncharacterized protein (TIGR00251 family)
VVRVQPGARQRGLIGWLADGALKVRVTEPPEDGRANRAVVELLAEALGVAPARLEVKRGAASRTKQIAVSGIDGLEARSRIERALAGRTQRGDGDAR